MAGRNEEDDLDQALDAALIGGREPRDVQIVDYRDDWPKRFERERERIEQALGDVARRIEHIGSTSVPGLAAKPVVDIIVGVDDPDDERVYLAPMEAAGYVLRVREPGHRMFRTPERDVHVHVWTAGGDDERRHLVFRDWLRSHAGDRDRYERAKRDLAGHWRDTNYYTRAKGPLVEEILRRASGGATGQTS